MNRPKINEKSQGWDGIKKLIGGDKNRLERQMLVVIAKKHLTKTGTDLFGNKILSLR